MRLDKIIEENLKTTRKEMKRLFLMKKSFNRRQSGNEPPEKCG